jgi:hypothetical protein
MIDISSSVIAPTCVYRRWNVLLATCASKSGKRSAAVRVCAVAASRYATALPSLFSNAARK